MNKPMDINDFMKLVELLDLLPEKDRSRAASLLGTLHKGDYQKSENTKDIKTKKTAVNYTFLSLKPKTQTPALNELNNRGKNVYNYLYAICKDQNGEFTDEFKSDVISLLIKYVPAFGLVWRVSQAPKSKQKTGPKTDYARNRILRELVEIFYQSDIRKGYEGARNRLSDALWCIGCPLSSNGIRDAYNLTSVRHK